MTDGGQPVDRALLAGFPVVIELPVAWGEMDSYRHVNNVVYFRYFENARLEYFRRLDWFAFERACGIGPILAATRARFRKPLTYPDTISVAARVSALEDDRFIMEHLIVSHGQGVVTTEGQGTIVSFHYREHRKVPIPDEMRQRIQALETSVKEPGPGDAPT
jgi:acyl-CoA thioester hydrolase